jgi:N6-adenosine-specific RNA methylase IME4
MLEQKKYKTILADPPWDHNQRGNYGAVNHYDLMSIERIKAMPIKDLAEDDAHCWLWVTNGTMRQGYDVMEAWGFKVKSILTWIKPRLGLGNYLRNCTEHLMFGIKGKLPVQFNRQPTWFFAPLQEHSHKPEEALNVLERISPGPYLELFARRRYQPYWDVWGNEVPADIDIPGYPVPDSPETRKKKGCDAK